jgi:hypothetical protein
MAKRKIIDRKSLYAAVEGKFQDPQYSENINLLARECMGLSEQWLNSVQYTGKVTKREMRKDLKAYLHEKIDLHDTKSSYNFGSFIWVFIAQLVIGFIVRWIIDKYTYGTGK